MPRAPRRHLPDRGTYHVTTRGVNRGLIVRDELDWAALRALVERTLIRFGWHCDVYCLMSNHFHLIVRTRLSSLSDGMRWLNGVYAQRFNRRHNRTGHLFENRFSARVLETEEHWERSTRYVLDNPVKAGLCELASDWPWSGGAFLERPR